MFFHMERIKKILDELHKAIYTDKREIDHILKKEGNYKIGQILAQLPAVEGRDGWERYDRLSLWGGKNKHAWFRFEVTVPEEFCGKAVALEITTGREGQWDALNPQFIIYVDGRLVQGLDVNHRTIILAEEAKAGQSFAVDLHAYSGMNDAPFGLNAIISVYHKDVEALYYNIHTPYVILENMSKEDIRYIEMLNHLIEAVNMLDLRKMDSEDFHQSVKAANTYLEDEFYGKFCGNSDVTASVVGHTHIDVAWLWTYAQTREKTIRSFSTVLNLMKEYPEYTFMSSQPQLYQFLKEDEPELYEEIKKRVKEGRWEAEGAMWLEADCNLTSGESLVRQVLYGKKFFKEEFGIDSKILWLPDVFGYSAALPQILKKSGVDYFMTTKISWNEYNKLPYDTFMWKGIDGTEILTSFVTTQSLKDSHKGVICTTYNGDLRPDMVMGTWERYQQKPLNNDVLICYGFGDGGGGPTREMIEHGKRLSRGIPGCPKVKNTTALDYFRRLESRVSGSRRLPKWDGELYLEYHRGTYTSMARIKKANRKCEFLLQAAETYGVMANVLAGVQIPKEELDKQWRSLLLNQFHDVLPGSSIKEVYEDADRYYAEISTAAGRIKQEAEQAIADRVADEPSGSDTIVVFNPLGFERKDIVEVELDESLENEELAVKDLDGNTIPGQRQGNRLIFMAERVPSKGYRAFKLERAEKAQTKARLQVTAAEMENDFYRLRFDENGNIAELYDKVNDRQVLKAGQKGNVLQAFEDMPHNYDAWDINIYYQEKMWEVNEVLSTEVIEQGPVRGTLRIRRKFLDSVISQDITIYAERPGIDFKTTIDWKERHVLLKAAFPVDINSNKAVYDIQFGNIERNTHWNTSWDVAKFETCAHKWVDYSEGGYGVSIMNDAKYGHEVRDGLMRLTLLKSATSPNVDADREVHEFTYTLYPHAGSFKEAGTVQLAYALNCPLTCVYEKGRTASEKSALPVEFSFAAINCDNVIIDTIKRAEDSDDYVVRVYECHNKRTKAELSFYKELAKAVECDLLERDVECSPLTVRQNKLSFEIRPFEIKTFKIRMR